MEEKLEGSIKPDQMPTEEELGLQDNFNDEPVENLNDEEGSIENVQYSNEVTKQGE